MIGYDRQVSYSYGSPLADIVVSDYESDSDMAVDGSTSTSTRFPGIIEIDSDTSRDSDVIIQETASPVIDLVDSDTNESATVVVNVVPSTLNEIIGNTTDEVIEGSSVDDTENRKPVLPPKLRLKHKRQSHEKTSRDKRKCNITSSSSSSTSTDSSSSSDSSSDLSIPSNPRKRLKHQKEFGKYRYLYNSNERDHYRHFQNFNTDTLDDRNNLNHSSDSEAAPIKQRWKARNKKMKYSKPSGNYLLNNPRYNERPAKYSKSHHSLFGSNDNSSIWNNTKSSQETLRDYLLENKPSTCTENKYKEGNSNACHQSYSYFLDKNIPSCSRNRSERTVPFIRERPSDVSTEIGNNLPFNQQSSYNNSSYSTNTRNASPDYTNVYQRYWGLSEEKNFPSCSKYSSEGARNLVQEHKLFNNNSAELYRNHPKLDDNSHESFKESFSRAHHLRCPSVPSKIVMAVPIKQAAEESDSESSN